LNCFQETLLGVPIHREYNHAELVETTVAYVEGTIDASKAKAFDAGAAAKTLSFAKSVTYVTNRRETEAQT
jgi:hypothetical protein